MSTASCYSITRDSNHIVKFTLFLWWPPRSCRWREDGSRDQELGRLEGRRYYPWLCKILFWCRGFCQVGSHDTFFKLQKYTVLQFLPWNYQRLERFFYWFNRTGNCCNLQISPAHLLQPKIINWLWFYYQRFGFAWHFLPHIHIVLFSFTRHLRVNCIWVMEILCKL